MELKSMKMEKGSGYNGPSTAEAMMPEYSYGLRLTMSHECLEKLGITEPLEVGAQMKMMALVEVVSSSAEKKQDGTMCMRAELQITDMAIK